MLSRIEEWIALDIPNRSAIKQIYQHQLKGEIEQVQLTGGECGTMLEPV